MPALPIPQSFIMCDYASIDIAGKLSLCGCFGDFQATAFPATFGCVLCIVLTDGHGKVPVDVEMVDLENGNRSPIASGEFTFADPLHNCNLTIQTRPTFTKPGTYAFEASSKGNLIVQRRFVVRQLAGGNPIL